MALPAHSAMLPLGNRLTVYRPGTGKIILIGILCVFLGLPCSIAGIRYNTSPTVYSDSSNSPGQWLMTIGFGLCLICILALILALNNRRMRAEVYEQGFIAINKHGKQEVYWNQVVHVWHKLEKTETSTTKDPQTGVSTPKIRKISVDVYVVQCADGTSCEIDTSFYGLSKFATALEQTYPHYLFPRAMASYQSGNSLTFVTLTISPAGIGNALSDGNVQSRWGSFNAVRVDRQKSAITMHRGTESQLWSTISVTDTPDIAVFEALVNTIASQR